MGRNDATIEVLPFLRPMPEGFDSIDMDIIRKLVRDCHSPEALLGMPMPATIAAVDEWLAALPHTSEGLQRFLEDWPNTPAPYDKPGATWDLSPFHVDMLSALANVERCLEAAYEISDTCPLLGEAFKDDNDMNAKRVAALVPQLEHARQLAIDFLQMFSEQETFFGSPVAEDRTSDSTKYVFFLAKIGPPSPFAPRPVPAEPQVDPLSDDPSPTVALVRAIDLRHDRSLFNGPKLTIPCAGDKYTMFPFRVRNGGRIFLHTHRKEFVAADDGPTRERSVFDPNYVTYQLHEDPDGDLALDLGLTPQLRVGYFNGMEQPIESQQPSEKTFPNMRMQLDPHFAHALDPLSLFMKGWHHMEGFIQSKFADAPDDLRAAGVLGPSEWCDHCLRKFLERPFVTRFDRPMRDYPVEPRVDSGLKLRWFEARSVTGKLMEHLRFWCADDLYRVRHLKRCTQCRGWDTNEEETEEDCRMDILRRDPVGTVLASMARHSLVLTLMQIGLADIGDRTGWGSLDMTEVIPHAKKGSTHEDIDRRLDFVQAHLSRLDHWTSILLERDNHCFVGVSAGYIRFQRYYLCRRHKLRTLDGYGDKVRRHIVVVEGEVFGREFNRQEIYREESDSEGYASRSDSDGERVTMKGMEHKLPDLLLTIQA
ncbi:hypothetical protein HIM_07352 [Hirsutella minnesotensis 3608]|uniref:Uncharacterized protein n=1 Tax=Hirsutella minnesotensis 3608 TaxID=1043627 RepID=A0A0F7ZTM0_9HYPO|nr:hypothetical protein HIM_07352 [Hirsutella minnesotensis 3608]